MARQLQQMKFQAAALRGGLAAWRKAAGWKPTAARPIAPGLPAAPRA